MGNLFYIVAQGKKKYPVFSIDKNLRFRSSQHSKKNPYSGNVK
jgi:hypothetical protein